MPIRLSPRSLIWKPNAGLAAAPQLRSYDNDGLFTLLNVYQVKCEAYFTGLSDMQPGVKSSLARGIFQYPFIHDADLIPCAEA